MTILAADVQSGQPGAAAREGLRQPARDYGSYGELLEAYFQAGWTDGLPIVPPTPEKVAAFLAAGHVAAGRIVGSVPTREITVSAEQVAINAIMAGCRPEYMPIVLAAVRAHLSPKANCHSTTATLSGAAQLVLVNGPARRELGIVCREGCFGPGSRANATIGRALRLVIRNVCRAVPGFADRASFSQPARLSACFGEDEEGGHRPNGAGWSPLHVELGFAAEQNVVTMYSFTDYYAYLVPELTSPEAFLDGLIRFARSRPISLDTNVGDDRAVIIVVGPEHRDFLVDAGWSKGRIRDYLFPGLVAPNGHGLSGDLMGNVPIGGALESNFNLARAEGILIVGAGGAGSGTWIFYPHLCSAVSTAC